MKWETKHLLKYVDDRPFRLWVYYYTLTERFDRGRLLQRPSLYEDDVVVPYGFGAGESMRYSSKIKKLIYDVADYYGINREIIDNAKSELNRMTQTGIEREYDAIYAIDGFEFIDKYIEEKEKDGLHNGYYRY